MLRSSNRNKLIIGIYLDSSSTTEQLFKTLFHIITSTEIEFEIVLLLDHVKPEIRKEITNMLTYSLIAEFNVSGRPAYFNKLIEKEADFYCFMECGIWVGPKCLDRMIDQLKNNRKIGITGPTTNNCWNLQSLYNDQDPGKVDVTNRIKEHSKIAVKDYQEIEYLAESILLVTRETIEKIGYADEKYANGFYWENDYCIRIKKSGLKIVWLKSVYAHKSFVAADTTRNKTSLHNVNYLKDKFCCKADLKKTKEYCDQCNEFDCQEFARSEKVELKLSKHKDQPGLPLVSCIMPTKDRSHFILQSVKYFQEQDYPNLELIIVYETDADIPNGWVPKENIRLYQVRGTNSIGSKRNIACQKAKGSIIIHWDDDDWYSPDRISKQVTPIIENECDITALTNALFYLPANNEFWECSTELSKKMLVKNVFGGTLAFNKQYWEWNHGYPDSSLREDADFLIKMVQKGAALKEVDGRELFIYLRHDSNSWTFKTGSFLEPHEWKKTETPACILSQLEFYHSLKTSKKDDTPPVDKLLTPKVTCIMPTADRREFVPTSINQFLNQVYKNKELVVIDDGNDKIIDLIPQECQQIKYISLKNKVSIGTKRNMACKKATGEIIIHWDDDDWVSPGWINQQVEGLLQENADVTGLNCPYFFQPATGNAWQYHYPETQKPWVHGGTLCYTKKLWERNPFPEVSLGEDASFLWNNCPKKIVPHNGIDHYVGIIHEKNASPKHTEDKRWQVVSGEKVKKNMR